MTCLCPPAASGHHTSRACKSIGPVPAPSTSVCKGASPQQHGSMKPTYQRSVEHIALVNRKQYANGTFPINIHFFKIRKHNDNAKYMEIKHRKFSKMMQQRNMF